MLSKKISNIIKLWSFILIGVLFMTGCNNKSDVLILSGSVESTQIDISSEVPGKIIKLDKEEGTVLNTGDIVASIDSSMQELIVRQHEAAVKIKQARLDELKALPKPEQIKKDSAIKAAEGDLEQSLAALEQSKLTLSKYDIKAPIKGTYLYKNVNTGDMVNVGTSIGTVSDISDLWVRVYIPQKYLNLVKLNQEINLSSTALPNEIIKGKTVFIASEAEFTPKNTETTEAKENTVFKVKIKILDHLDTLRPGMAIECSIPIK